MGDAFQARSGALRVEPAAQSQAEPPATIAKNLWLDLAAAFGPTLKEAFPDYTAMERMRVADALAEVVKVREGWFAADKIAWAEKVEADTARLLSESFTNGRRAGLEEARISELREAQYLIWSNEHRCWWAPNRCGYTVNIDRAGRYSREEAIGIAATARGGWEVGKSPDEIAIPEADAIEQSQHPDRLEAWKATASQGEN